MRMQSSFYYEKLVAVILHAKELGAYTLELTWTGSPTHVMLRHPPYLCGRSIIAFHYSS